VARADAVSGCLIVELFDYRPQRNKDTSPDRPDRTRVVLNPNSETLWADICSLNQKHGAKWTDLDVLEIESKFLVRITRLAVCAVLTVL
jgi:transcription factor SPT20